MKYALDKWERWVACVVFSPWSSLIWIIYCAIWFSTEFFLRGKFPGYDGVAQWIFGEVALATFRRLGDGRAER